MPRIAALILLAVCALGAADLALIDLRDKGLLGHVAANEPDKAGLSLFSLVQAKSGPALAVVCKAADSYPGIAIKPARPWDLSACAWAEATIANTGEQPVAVNLRLDNDGDWKSNPWNCEFATIAPGQTAKVRVTFGRSFGQPGFALDAKRVVRVLLFLAKPKTDAAFSLIALTAGGKP